jgi:hypothetical protein
MTLQQLLQQLADHPAYLVFYFAIIPIMAFLAGILGRGEGHLPPWRYLYSILIYFICVPGIFSITLSAYQFLFERRSIMDADVFAQVLPVISMVITLLIIRKNVNLDYIPGFDKLGGLVMMITAVLALMWLVDRTRLIVFSYIRIEYVLLILVGLLVLVRYGWRRALVSERRA